MSSSLSVRYALRALAEPAAGQDSNGMHRRHLALLGSRTGETRASVGTALSNRHIRGMIWHRSLCGSGCRSGPSVNRCAGQDAATRSRLQDAAPSPLPQNLLATFLLSVWNTSMSDIGNPPRWRTPPSSGRNRADRRPSARRSRGCANPPAGRRCSTSARSARRSGRSRCGCAARSRRSVCRAGWAAGPRSASSPRAGISSASTR